MQQSLSKLYNEVCEKFNISQNDLLDLELDFWKGVRAEVGSTNAQDILINKFCSIEFQPWKLQKETYIIEKFDLRSLKKKYLTERIEYIERFSKESQAKRAKREAKYYKRKNLEENI